MPSTSSSQVREITISERLHVSLVRMLSWNANAAIVFPSRHCSLEPPEQTLDPNLSSRRLLKTQMERVKLNKSINWVSAKSQSSKTNRFKVLNEKDNRIREPDIQRERHFTVLDPVNHLVGYPRVQVQEGRVENIESVVTLPSESGLLL